MDLLQGGQERMLWRSSFRAVCNGVLNSCGIRPLWLVQAYRLLLRLLLGVSADLEEIGGRDGFLFYYFMF